MGSSWTDRPPPLPPTLGTEVGHLVSQPPGSAQVLGLGNKKLPALHRLPGGCASSGLTCQSWLPGGKPQAAPHWQAVAAWGGARRDRHSRVGAAWTPTPRLWTGAGERLLEPRGPLGPQHFGDPRILGLPVPRRISRLAFRTPGRARWCPFSSLQPDPDLWVLRLARIYNPELLFISSGSRRFAWEVFQFPPGLDQTAQISEAELLLSCLGGSLRLQTGLCKMPGGWSRQAFLTGLPLTKMHMRGGGTTTASHHPSLNVPSKVTTNSPKPQSPRTGPHSDTSPRGYGGSETPQSSIPTALVTGQETEWGEANLVLLPLILLKL